MVFILSSACLSSSPATGDPCYSSQLWFLNSGCLTLCCLCTCVVKVSAIFGAAGAEEACTFEKVERMSVSLDESANREQSFEHNYYISCK